MDASLTKPAATPARLQVDGEPLAEADATARMEAGRRAKGRGKGVVCRFYGTKAGRWCDLSCPALVSMHFIWKRVCALIA